MSFDPYEPKEAELKVEYIRPLYYITLTKIYPKHPIYQIIWKVITTT